MPGNDFNKEPSKPKNNTLDGIVPILIVLIILYSLSDWAMSFANEQNLELIKRFVFSVPDAVKEVFIGLSTISIFLFIFVVIKLREARSNEYNTFKARPQKVKKPERDDFEWLSVIKNADSNNEAQWRVAILEADSILEKVLNKNGYTGETIADQLKSIPDGRFVYLNEIWDAHKVRNTIAHSGSEFTLSSKEALRVVGLYENFFKEAGYIQ